ncbi:MAG: cyclic nucleotide-binding/CBS domain-containing protein [Pirellulaceae bacterium]
MGLHTNMRTEPVERLHLREALLVQRDDTVREVVVRMREKQLGCVYIVDEQRKPIGIFTEHLLNRVLVENPSSLDAPVGNHMVSAQTNVKMSDPIVRVLSAMQGDDKRFVCVLDDEGRVAALTGQKGLMEYIGEHFPGQIMVQRIGCAPFIHQREGA